MGGYITKKVAIITGAASGIGRAASIELAKDGFISAAVDLNFTGAQKTKETIEAIGGMAEAFQCDIGKVADINTMVENVAGRFGRIDVLANCAGICANRPMAEITEEIWDMTMAVDLKGAFFLSRAVFSKMLEGKNGGRIINISSVAGERGGLNSGIDYSVAKGGILTLTKCLALQGAEHGITANVIAPGTIDTEMTIRLGATAEGIPLGRKGTPEEIAYAIKFLVSAAAGYITGLTMDINGGQYMR